MILSERAAIMDDAMHKLKAGDVVNAVVRNLAAYGAFVSIKDPETAELTGGHVRSLTHLCLDVVFASMRFITSLRAVLVNQPQPSSSFFACKPLHG